MLGGICQYDPECPVHRHRPGTTCPVVYRKMRAAEKAQRRRRANIISLCIYVPIIVIFIVFATHPWMMDAVGSWLANLWPAVFGPGA